MTVTQRPARLQGTVNALLGSCAARHRATPRARGSAGTCQWFWDWGPRRSWKYRFAVGRCGSDYGLPGRACGIKKTKQTDGAEAWVAGRGGGGGDGVRDICDKAPDTQWGSQRQSGARGRSDTRLLVSRPATAASHAAFRACQRTGRPTTWRGGGREGEGEKYATKPRGTRAPGSRKGHFSSPFVIHFPPPWTAGHARLGNREDPLSWARSAWFSKAGLSRCARD